MRDFRKYDVWKESIELTDLIYMLVDKMPENEKFGLRKQMSRAAVSVASNIAEGASRHSQKDFFRFLEISMGSLFELETQLFICRRQAFLSDIDVDACLAKILLIQKRLNTLMQKLK